MQETITILLIVTLGFTTWQGLNNPGVMNKYLFSTDGIRLRREWMRLVTPAFLHANWYHFASNAITIYLFGRYIETLLGSGFLLLLFFGSVAGGHLLCLKLHPTSDYRSIGASGGALGILFCMVLLEPNMIIWFFVPAWLYALGFLFITLGSIGGGSGVSHEAHFGGMLAGVLITLIRVPSIFRESPLLLSIILTVSGLGLWYFHVNPGRVPGFFGMQVKGALSQQKQKQTAREQQTVDELLDKVSKQGLHSLSNRERKILEAASKNRRAKR